MKNTGRWKKGYRVSLFRCHLFHIKQASGSVYIQRSSGTAAFAVYSTVNYSIWASSWIQSCVGGTPYALRTTRKG